MRAKDVKQHVHEGGKHQEAVGQTDLPDVDAEISVGVVWQQSTPALADHNCLGCGVGRPPRWGSFPKFTPGVGGYLYTHRTKLCVCAGTFKQVSLQLSDLRIHL